MSNPIKYDIDRLSQVMDERIASGRCWVNRDCVEMMKRINAFLQTKQPLAETEEATLQTCMHKYKKLNQPPEGMPVFWSCMKNLFRYYEYIPSWKLGERVYKQLEEHVHAYVKQGPSVIHEAREIMKKAEKRFVLKDELSIENIRRINAYRISHKSNEVLKISVNDQGALPDLFARMNVKQIEIDCRGQNLPKLPRSLKENQTVRDICFINVSPALSRQMDGFPYYGSWTVTTEDNVIVWKKA